jgi:hypothetical protein
MRSGLQKLLIAAPFLSFLIVAVVLLTGDEPCQSCGSVPVGRQERPVYRRPHVNGIYENCALAKTESLCLARLAEMHRIGMHRVLNYWAWKASDDQLLAYADRAAELGIKLIYPLNDFSRIELVKDHPATWGYAIPEEQEFDAALIDHDLATSLDPDHPTMYAEWGAMTRRHAAQAPIPDVYLAEWYPVGMSNHSISETRRIVRTAKEVAGPRATVILQAFDWNQESGIPTKGPGGFPTAKQMCRMSRMANQHLTMWFDYYFVSPPGPYIVKPPANAPERLKRAIECDREWGAAQGGP